MFHEATSTTRQHARQHEFKSPLLHSKMFGVIVFFPLSIQLRVYKCNQTSPSQALLFTFCTFAHSIKLTWRILLCALYQIHSILKHFCTKHFINVFPKWQVISHHSFLSNIKSKEQIGWFMCFPIGATTCQPNPAADCILSFHVTCRMASIRGMNRGLFVT